MLVLRSSSASPFGRKVKLTASILGLSDRIQIVDADTLNPEDSIRQQNPLGKIPALILENGDVLYDSRVIVDYLDHLAGGGGVIPNGAGRFSALRDQALADGIMDAALLQVYEGRFRPEDRHEPKWVSHQADKVRRGLDHAEAHLSQTRPGPSYRPDRPCLRPGLSRPALRRPLARELSQARRLARRFRVPRPGLREDQGDAINKKGPG